MSQRPGDEIEVRNRQTLEELAQTLEWSVGEFHLFLARCNYVAVRSQLITQLQDICSIRLQIITLTADTQQLYTTIRDAIAVSPAPAEGIIVVGFEQVKDLDRLFANADAAREEFRKQLHMPIVLWMDDTQFNSFKDRAPNFETWAPVDTPTFEIPTDTIIQSLHQGIEAIYAACFKPNQPQLANDPDQPLPKHVRAAIDVAQLGDLRRSELAQALQTLSDRAVALPADLRADLHLVEGADAGLNEAAIEHFQACVDYWRGQAQVGQANETTPAADLKLALALFFLGRFYFHRTDETRRLDQAQYDNRNWQQARPPLEESWQLFVAANRLDMVAKISRHLLGTLRRLEAWDDLEPLLNQVIPLHQQYHMLNRLAMDYGFLAELKLHEQDWVAAKHYADLAVKTIQPLPLSRQWAEGLYLALQAKAEVQLGNEAGAITLLEWARALGDRGHPTIYSRILGELRDLYWQQKRYLEAFKLKQARLEVEKIAGIRAFVGAGRLGAQARLVEESDEPAPEIYASGRQLDLQAILGRINSTDSKLTVLHGDSGVGKSSLVNAGLIPALQKEAIGYRSALPVIVRQYMNWEKELATALTESIQASSRSKTVQVPESSPDILAMLRQCEQNNRCIVLVFDQFEEFFFANPDPVQRRQFFQFLSNCLGIAYLNIILSLREDYLHYLLEASRALRGVASPNMLSQNLFGNILGRDILYPIGNFSPEQAKAIIDDLTRQSRSYLEPDLVDALVADLAGPLQEVRPIELQIVGSQLETERIRSLAQYRELGEQPKEELVSRYLQEVVDDCGTEYEQIAELVLYLLTDERGTRPLKTRSDLLRELQVLLGDVLTPDPSPTGRGEMEKDRELLPSPGGRGAGGEGTLDHVLRILCGSGIVVYLPEDLDDRYQLVHDYIAETIRRQKAPQLEALMAELTEERQKRAQAEEDLAAARVANLAAQQALAEAQAQKEKTLIGTKIEREGVAALRKFVRGQQLEGIIQALKAAIHLKTLVQDAPLSQYPAYSPIYSLQQMLYASTEQSLLFREQNWLSGHKGSILDVSFSPNGQQIATASSDRTARIWSRSGELLQELSGHQGTVNSVKFSPDGRQIITISDDGIARIWSYDGKLLKDLSNYQESVNNVIFSPGGPQIATISKDGAAQIWDLSGKLLQELGGHPSRVFRLSFSPDDQRIAAVLSDGTARIWSNDGQLLQELNEYPSKILSVSFSPDGEQIATVSSDGTARIWSYDGQLLQKLSGHQRAIMSISFSPNGQQIATASSDGTARIWNLNRELLQELSKHNGTVNSVSFSPDGEHIATASDDYTIRIWSRSRKLVRELSGHSSWVLNTSFSPNGHEIATASADGTARIWSNKGKLIKELRGHQGTVRSVSFSPNGQQIATASSDGTARIWSRDGKLLRTLNVNRGAVLSVSFNSDSQQVVTVSSDGTAQIWNHNGKLLQESSGHWGRVLSVSSISDSQQIATTLDDGTVKIWNCSGDLLQELSGHQGTVNSVSFSPNGQQIVTASDDYTARIWSHNGKLLQKLSEHRDRVLNASFSLDDQQVATVSDDGIVRIWSCSGDLLQELSGHQGTVWSVSFSPNGQQLATASSDCTVRIWQVYDLKGLIALGCDWIRDYLIYNPEVSDEDRALCGIPKREE